MKKLAIAFALLPSLAFGQQPTPETQALGQKLMSEINASITCNAQLITLQEKLTKANEEIAALKEPKKPEPNK